MTPLEALRTEIEYAISQREEAISHGRIKNWDEYQFITGTLAGARIALNRINDLIRIQEEI